MKFLTICTLLFSFSVSAEHHYILHFPSDDSKDRGKSVVLVSGDEEYRSEESMPMLAKILSQKHGFNCKVLFSWDESGKYIDPNNPQGVKGWHHLEDADLMIIGTRYRNPNPEDAKFVTNFLNAGKPVIGIRTSTHAFNGGGSFGEKISFGEFGPLIIGEGWVSHHGKHKKEGARGIIEASNAAHPILKGVTDVFGPSDVYEIKSLTEKDTILMRGAVTTTLEPNSSFVDEKNDPMQPLAWLHPYEAPNGKKGITFCTTMGASVDFVSEDLRRLIVNAAHHLTGLKVPNRADVEFVDAFYPSFYGFIREDEHWPSLNRQPEEYGLGKSPRAPELKGSPEWPFRDTPK
ncbi:MAG: hypothetical protein CMI27_06455 [Opitutae bacterium]|nr:hypothetical protein [Opitutae bacterium]|tara:strand:- start:1093 stop:2133 length:1041 start_codon:yes stop_codon:yes gene_type:complete